MAIEELRRRVEVRRDHEKWWDWVHPAIKEFFVNAITGYTDTSRSQNYIGSEAVAFTRRMLPLYEWKGPGEVVRKQALCTAPQVYVTQTVVPTGIAGIAAGQIWNGGLMDSTLNPNLSGEGG